MPLARIFTHHPERTTSLSEELQKQGYQVEVRSPDQTHLAPADLEIEFEICDRADVLKRAATLGDELQADVAVAPGVLATAAQIQPAAQMQQKVQQVQAEALPQKAAAHAPEAEPRPARPVLAEKTAAPVFKPVFKEEKEEKAAAPVQADKTPVEVAAPPTQELDREREFEAAFARTEQPAEEQLLPMIEHPAETVEEAAVEGATEYDPLPPVAFMEEPAAMRAEPVIVPVHESAIPEETSQPAAREEAARPIDPVPYLAQWKPFSTPSAHTAAEERHSMFAESRGEDRTEAAPAQPAAQGMSHSAASIFSTAMAGARGMSASAAESFREWLQEYKKRAQVRKAEARAARVARMLDLEQRKAEAQQRAAELEAAREAAAARLLDLVRQRDPGLPKESLPKESLLQESLAGERFSDDRKAAEPYFRPAPQRTPMESLRHASIERMQAKPRRPMSPQLRAVLTGAAAISILFVIGIVLGELYPRAPLANPTEHSASGVTVQTGVPAAQSGGVTVKTGQQARPAPQPSASAAQAPAQEKPSPRVSQTRHVAAQQGENTIGDDVVVRHYSRPVPTQKPKQSGQQAGLKHFSDMEN